jgi:phenylpropionate dioxygenase-like ring-hydroxylating dioxygenase large terminal subunit
MFINLLLLLCLSSGFYNFNIKKSINYKPIYFESKIENQNFDWEKQWYPIAVEKFTDKQKSHKISLLGNDLVLWYNGNTWSVFEDRCPHRGVPLSEGRVEKSGELLCAYHAWTFNGDGKCTNIPQSIDQTQKLRACVKNYPTQINQGLIWVWGSNSLDSLLKEPRLIEELQDPQYNNKYKPFNWYSRDLPYGWDMFMENVLDPSHVPVAHHGIVGNRYNDTHNIKFKRIKNYTENGDINDTGFSYLMENENVSIIHDFRPPCLTKITISLPDGGKTLLALYATPTKPGYCRYFGFQLLIKPENSLNEKPKGLGLYDLSMPDWLLHILTSIFLHQDLVLLHYQDRILLSESNYAFGNFDKKFNLSNNFKSYSKNYYMPIENDKQVISLRHWISKKANGGPVWKNVLHLPSKLNSKELFDVYDSHTKNCLTCQKKLKYLSFIQIFSICGIVSYLFSSNLLYAGLLSVIVIIVSKIITMFYTYEFHHQNNN